MYVVEESGIKMGELQETKEKKLLDDTKFKLKQETLLLLITCFLVLSTYAWFTSNTFVKIEEIDINVQTSNGLEISVDALNWKEVLANKDILTGEDWGGHLNYIPQDYMKQTSTAGEVNGEGFLRMFSGGAIGGVLTAKEEPDGKKGLGYIVFDIFLKTNQDRDLYLDVDANVIGALGENGLTNGMENAVRVGFVVKGHVKPADYTSPGGVNIARGLNNVTQVIIWEPNSNSHTEAAIEAAFSCYGVRISQNEVIRSYSGVKAPISTPVPLIQANHRDNPGLFGEITGGALGSRFTFIQTPKPMRSPNYYLNIGDGELGDIVDLGVKLEPGVTKIRVYMWIEGQDYDCEDLAAGLELQFNLSFIGEINTNY